MENSAEKYAVVSGQSHNPGINVDWSPEEQKILEDALAESFHGHFAIKYAMIASWLNDKTARDVALRRRWMILRDENEADEGKNIEKEAPASKKMKKKPTKSNEKGQKPLTVEKIRGVIGDLMRDNNLMLDRINEIGSDLRLIEEKNSLMKLTKANLIKIKHELENVPFESMIPMPPFTFFNLLD